MKNYLVFIALTLAVAFTSCSDDKGKENEKPTQEVTIEYLKKVEDGKPAETAAEKKTVKIEIGTKINKEYLTTAKLLPEVKDYEYDSMSPAEVVVGKEKVSVKVYYKAKAAPKN